jgi:hypothetical protein
MSAVDPLQDLVIQIVTMANEIEELDNAPLGTDVALRGIH